MRTIYGAIPDSTTDDETCREAINKAWDGYRDARDSSELRNLAHTRATTSLFEIYQLTAANPVAGRFARRAAREVFGRCVIETYRTRLNPQVRPWESVQLEQEALKTFIGFDASTPLEGLLELLLCVGRPYLARGRVLVGNVVEKTNDGLVINYRGKRFRMLASDAPLGVGVMRFVPSAREHWWRRSWTVEVGGQILFTTTGIQTDLPLVRATTGSFLQNALATLFWPTLDDDAVKTTVVRTKGLGFAVMPLHAFDQTGIDGEVTHLADFFRLRYFMVLPAFRHLGPFDALAIEWYARHVGDAIFGRSYRLTAATEEGVRLRCDGGIDLDNDLLFDFGLMVRKLVGRPELPIQYEGVRRHWALKRPATRLHGFGCGKAEIPHGPAKEGCRPGGQQTIQ